MINVKGGTQTWSTSPQRADFKSDGKQNISAMDKDKLMQDQDLGDLLNKVADPNYVDTSKKMRTVGNNELGKDAFMSLLLTQMKNQDPTNPLKSHEMAAQLAQFTSLEKLHNINAGIDGLRTDQQPNHNFQALSFIGKAVTTDNSKISRMDAEARHDVRFNLPADATSLKMQVKDADGTVVRNLEFKNLRAGSNELNWNGLTEDGTPAPLGDYSITMEAVGSNGRKIYVESKTEGIISGVNFTSRGPQLMIGKQVVNMSDVKSISQPMAGLPSMLEAQHMPNMHPMPQPVGGNLAVPALPKMKPIKSEENPDAAKKAKMSKGDLNDVAMAQGLINQLNKSGAKAGMDGGT